MLRFTRVSFLLSLAVLLLIGRPTFADQEICGIKVTSATLEAAAGNPLAQVATDPSPKIYIGKWSSGCAGLVFPKEGTVAGARYAQVSYTYNLSAADQGTLKTEVIPVENDGKMIISVPGCRSKQMQLVPDGTAFKGTCTTSAFSIKFEKQ
ncbi:hypothetical protein K8Q93_03800 [Candidatus Parcubacteria bacterium]|nr:hypothetical protein [Candidatus Parcubacteria bacterium]